MSHPNKVKGTGYEREIVKAAQAVDLLAKRAWGSNGEALGFSKEVDHGNTYVMIPLAYYLDLLSGPKP
jgi:hypothetical protein